jgi:outer membrane receptor protein involved in Fe transport
LAYDLKGLQFGGDVRVFVTVNNLFDQKPPLIVAAGTPGGFYPTSRDIYDIVGRYITVGARAKF